MAYGTFTFTVKVADLEAAPHSPGTLEVWANVPEIRDAAGDLALSGKIKEPLDEFGAATVTLPADDPTLSPSEGLGYTARVLTNSGSFPTKSFAAQAAGTTLDWADLSSSALPTPLPDPLVRTVNGVAPDATGNVDATSGSVPDATSTVKGKIALAGDLGGTADLPTVPGLAGKESAGTAASLLSAHVAAADPHPGYALETDPRLSDARTPTAHTHDDRYFTEAEVTTALEGKSDTSHNHAGVYAPALGADDNYVTDAEKAALHSHANKTALDNVSGVNTGDQDLSALLTTAAAPELIRDTMGTALVAGSNVTITPNDAGDTITIAATSGSGTPGRYVGVNAQTGTTYTPVLTDEGKLVTLTNAAAITVTLPQDSALAFPTGGRIDFAGLGAGLATFVAGTGATVNGTPSLVQRARYGAFTAIKVAANTWLVVGDLA